MFRCHKSGGGGGRVARVKILSGVGPAPCAREYAIPGPRHSHVRTRRHVHLALVTFGRWTEELAGKLRFSVVSA